MKRIVLAIGAAAALALAVAATGSAGPRAVPTLVGTVGPGFTITLKQNGKVVKALRAGSYRLVVHDEASIHAFSLTGPHGFAKNLTTVAFTGTKTLRLALGAGTYTYFCPPHRASMLGRFRVS